MNALDGRHVVVSAGRLDDLTELAARAAERLATTDPALADAIRASAAELRLNAVLEP